MLAESNRVGICDPLPAFRSGLRAALAGASFVVDEPDDIVDWAEQRIGPSVVMSVGRESEWRTLGGLCDRRPDAVVVALLDDSSPSNYREALKCGAKSALPRCAPESEVVDVVLAAIDERVVMPFPVAAELLGPGPDQTESEPKAVNDFADDERSWLNSLADGITVDDLAWRHGYSRRTMYRRLQAIYRRLGVSRRDQALVVATRTGVI